MFLRKDNKCFSTESAAKEYVINHKPFLSVNDVMNLCDDIENPSEFNRRSHFIFKPTLKFPKNVNKFLLNAKT